MKNNSVYIIAETGLNHNGSLEIAKQLIDVAANTGADAVKFLFYNAEKFIAQNAEKTAYLLKASSPNETQIDALKKYEFTLDELVKLEAHARFNKIDFLVTPLESDSVAALDAKFNLPFYKIASFDITNARLVLRIAQTGKPVVVSTGMATLGEIELALGILAFGYLSPNAVPSTAAFKAAYISPEGQAVLQEKVTLLHCTFEYPAPIEEVNLNALITLRNAYQLPVGFSDHTASLNVSIAAVALGATVVEKHLTIDRSLPGPDQAASLEPYEMRLLVAGVRDVEAALGSSVKAPAASEMQNRQLSRKSLTTCAPIKKGELFSLENLTVKRPGTGVSAYRFWDYMGQPASRDYAADELIDSPL